MGLERGLADEERSRDLGVAQTSADLDQDVALPPGEVGEDTLVAGLALRETLDQRRVTVGSTSMSPRATDRYRVQQPLTRRVREQEAGGAPPSALIHVVVESRWSVPARGPARHDGHLSGLDAVGPGHPDVHHEHVQVLSRSRARWRRPPSTRATISRSGLGVLDHRQSFAHHVPVVHDGQHGSLRRAPRCRVDPRRIANRRFRRVSCLPASRPLTRHSLSLPASPWPAQMVVDARRLRSRPVFDERLAS